MTNILNLPLHPFLDIFTPRTPFGGAVNTPS